jgi:hypothetical protein
MSDEVLPSTTVVGDDRRTVRVSAGGLGVGATKRSTSFVADGKPSGGAMTAAKLQAQNERRFPRG